MNILLINHNAGSLQHGMELRPYYFAREWVKAGHDVTIVAASFSYCRQQNIAYRRLVEEKIDNIRYIWLPVPGHEAGHEEHFANIEAFARQLELYADRLVELQPNFVIDASIHPLAAASCLKLAQRCKAKYVAEIHDLWELMPLADSTPENIARLEEAERFRLSQAERIITALPNFSKYLEAYGIEKKSWCIPNGINLDEHKSVLPLASEYAEAIAKLKEEGKFLIGYAGALGNDKALDVLIDAAKKLEQQPVHFLLLGDGNERLALQQQAQELGLKNVSFFAPVHKNMVFSFLKAMDALYAGWKDSEYNKYGLSQTKIFEYMFASKPIIHCISSEEDLVDSVGCGMKLSAEDSEAIAGAVVKMLQQTAEQRQEMGRKGRDFVTTCRNYRALAEWYLQVCRLGF